MSHSTPTIFAAVAICLGGLAWDSPAFADGPAKGAASGTHPYEGHVFPLCSTPAVTGAESFDAHYTVGREAFEHGEHAEALKQFVMAYDADCKRHEILVIVSRAYEGDQNYADAARALELYLARVPDAPASAGIRERIQKLREKAKVQAEEKRRAAAQAPKVQNGAGTSLVEVPAATETKNEPSVIPWIIVGAGGAVFLAGGITLIAAMTSLPDGCNFGFPTSHCNDPKDVPEAERSRPATFVSFTMMGVGAATLATGLVLHFLDKPSSGATSHRQPRWFVTPVVGASYTGMGLSTSL